MNLKVQKLTTYVDSCPIVKDISFEIPVGTSLFVLGPNGSGKSTLIKTIIDDLREDLRFEVEKIYFNGNSVTAESDFFKGRQFSYVPQFPEIHPQITVGKYLELSRFPYWSENNYVDEDLLGEAIQRLKIDGLINRKLSTLSGGEIKKVMVAAAFYQNTPLVVLDEPFQALDPKIKSELAIFLNWWKESKKATFLIVSHDFYWSFKLADFVLFLNQGERKYFGPKKQVFLTENLEKVFDCKFSYLKEEESEGFFYPRGID